MGRFIIYTDGGYSVDRNIGAGAYIILKADERTIVRQDSFVLVRETSQRAELKAILEAVEALPDRSKALIVTDYLYATLSLGARPRRKNTPDSDLLMRYRELVRSKRLIITFRWVPAHGGDRWNEACDSLCTEALDAGITPQAGTSDPRREVLPVSD